MSLKVKFVLLITLCLLMVSTLVVGVLAVNQTINLQGTINFNVTDKSLYIQSASLQDGIGGDEQPLPNFLPGYVNTEFNLNLGTVDNTSGLLIIYLDIVNNTTTRYDVGVEYTGLEAVSVLTTGSILAGTGDPVTDSLNPSRISISISTEAIEINLNDIKMVITEYVYRANIIATSSTPTLATIIGSGEYELGDTVTLSATSTSDFDFFGWRIGSADGELVSSQLEYSFELTEESPLNYYAVLEEANSYLTYTTDVPAAGEATLQRCASGATNIVIPHQIYRSGTSYDVTAMYNGNSSSSGVFYQARSTLQSVTIPGSIEIIGNYAFYNCSHLTSAIISEGVASIGIDAFSGCSALQPSITDNGVKYLGNETNPYLVLWDGKDITTSTYVIPTDCEIIHSTAFQRCTNLTSITIPSSLTSIGSSSFAGCSALQPSIIDEYGVKYLGNETNPYLVLWDGEDITSSTFSIPSESKFMYDSAFAGCSSLTSVNLGDNSLLMSIGREAFSSCDNLTSITFPENLTSIGRGAFQSCDSLTSITIPEGVKRIEGSAFSQCDNLTSVIIRSSVTIIEYKVFYLCGSLKSVDFGVCSQLASIGEDAFSYCDSLTSITIPESVKSIETRAFYGCTSLSEINFNAMEIEDLASGNYVFYNAGQLGTGITVTFGSEVTKIPAYLFYPYNSSSYSPNITSIVFENNSKLTSIGNYAFARCSRLTSITIPNSVTSIGDSAFSGCSSLTSVIIPSSVTSIGKTPFSGCSALQPSITDNGVKYLGNETNPYVLLWDVTDTTLSSYSIPIGCKVIDSSTFSRCTSLTSIIIPEGVTSIGISAFSRCSSLTSVNIPKSVESIGATAFAYCSSLSSITIPESVTNIGTDAFYDCDNLTEVTIESSYTYTEADMYTNSCGYLLQRATIVRVLVSIVDGGYTNTYLNSSTWTKVLSDDGLYYIYTR